MQNHDVPHEKSSDESLVSLAQAGDNAAFAELIRRHQSNCSKLAFSILRDRSDAEDEEQNAYWKAFEHIGQFQQDSKFSTWLTRIVVNQCLMRLRQSRRAKFVYMDDVLIGVDRQIEFKDSDAGPEAKLGKREIAKVLDHEISRIPPLLRNVFLLRDVQELPMQDVAERLGISVAAAKSRLLRARIELRQRLEKHCGRLGPATLLA
jgi:RNA polymerase sigma-70 factor (ECF subfamily)